MRPKTTHVFLLLVDNRDLKNTDGFKMS